MQIEWRNRTNSFAFLAGLITDSWTILITAIVCSVLGPTNALASPGPPPPKVIGVFVGMERGAAAPLWKYKTEKPGHYYAHGYRGKAYLYDATDHVLMQVEPLTGSINWRLKIASGSDTDFWEQYHSELHLDSIPLSPTIVINGSLLVNEKSGAVLLRADPNGAFEILNELLLEYQDCTKDRGCDSIVRRDPQSGHELWRAGGKVRPSKPPFHQNDLVAPSRDYLLNIWMSARLIDAKSGETLWTTDAERNFGWEVLNSFSRKDAAFTVGHSLILASGQRSASYGGVFAHRMVAVDVASGKKLWSADLPRHDHPKRGNRQYEFIQLQSGLAFYDGLFINLLTPSGTDAPAKLWPSDEANAQLMDVTSLAKADENSLIATIEQHDKKAAKLIKLDGRGRVVWEYRGENITVFSSITIEGDTLGVSYELFDREISEATRLNRGSLKLSLKSGQPLQEQNRLAEVIPSARQGVLAFQSPSLFSPERQAYSGIAAAPSRKSGTVSFVSDKVVDEEVSNLNRFVSIVELENDIVLGIGSIAGSERAPGPDEPRTSSELLALLDNGTPAEVARAISLIDKFPDESRALLEHAERAVLNGRCKHYGCVSQLFSLKNVDPLDSIEHILSEGSGEILNGGYRALSSVKFKTLPPHRQERLVDRALRSLNDSYVPTRWDAAWFIMFADKASSKVPFAAYRKGLIDSLAADAGTQPDGPARKAETARTIGYLKGCGRAAWPNLVALGESELSSEKRMNQDLAQALESLAPYQTSDPEPFLNLVKHANDVRQQLAGFQKQQSAYPFEILVAALARFNHPKANSLLIELLENNESGDAVSKGLRYTPVSMTADQAITLMRKESTEVGFIAARSAISLREHSKQLAEPAIRALLRYSEYDATAVLEQLLSTFDDSALPAVKRILSEGKPRDQLQIVQALVRVGKKSVFKEAVMPLANAPHERIRTLAEQFLDSAQNETPRGSDNSARSHTDVEPVPAICL